jgi:hypothetical protein
MRKRAALVGSSILAATPIFSAVAADAMTNRAISLCTAEQERRTLRNGDDWIFFSSPGAAPGLNNIVQMRHVSRTERNQPIFETDRLNGIAWDGWVNWGSSLKRSYQPNSQGRGSWTSWSESASPNQFFAQIQCHAVFAHDKWKIDLTGAMFPPPTLADVPP